ncbi:pyridoxamine 5'-phosphate oxidase family protein [Deinococcus misasensis]|uniref:pyridoxamine 5'-phosphate oxidase family protein n=1 Tax=Deinococcus misasensis TaxID=392413 RepID=UPI00055639A8|nr:pyridoxamine 5'-phosphate oxidase family protein [Deinococcus misasensis]
MNDPKQTAHTEFLAKINELLKDIRIAMLTTQHQGGELFSRPMTTQEAEFDGTLYFLTSKKTGKIADLVQFPKVNLAYSHPGKNSYVSVSGRAQLLDDRQKIDELWNPINAAFFPDGKDDPDIVVLKIEAESAEYWDSPSSKIVQAYSFIKTAITGDHDHAGENERQKI